MKITLTLRIERRRPHVPAVPVEPEEPQKAGSTCGSIERPGEWRAHELNAGERPGGVCDESPYGKFGNPKVRISSTLTSISKEGSGRKQ